MSEKITYWIEKLLSWCCMLSIVGLTVVVAAQVITRAIEISLPWAEELARFLMIWLTFLGCSLALYRKGHLSVNFFCNMAPKPIRLALGIFTRLAMIGFFGVLTVCGFQLMLLSMNTISSSLQWSMGAVYSVLPLSSMISIYFIAVDLIQYIGEKGSEKA